MYCPITKMVWFYFSIGIRFYESVGVQDWLGNILSHGDLLGMQNNVYCIVEDLDMKEPMALNRVQLELQMAAAIFPRFCFRVQVN